MVVNQTWLMENIAIGIARRNRMNIEEFGFEKADLVVATAVNAYLKNQTPKVRKEILRAIVNTGGAETVIDVEYLAALIESAKTAAMIRSEEWKDGGDPLVRRTLDFIRETLLTVNGEEYVKAPPEGFLRFIEEWTNE